MGGLSLLLFGSIAISGLRMLVEANIDYSKATNMILSAVVLVVGLSGATLRFGNFELTGMALATVIAVLLSLFFAAIDKLKISNDYE